MFTTPLGKLKIELTASPRNEFSWTVWGDDGNGEYIWNSGYAAMKENAIQDMMHSIERYLKGM